MKLSTRSRYGTRLLLDMAQHYNQGPIQIGDIARRQEISVKYLEQIIIPLKRAHFIETVRGPKGGHVLARPPAEFTLAEIVALLEESVSLVECTERAEICRRADTCPDASDLERGGSGHVRHPKFHHPGRPGGEGQDGEKPGVFPGTLRRLWSSAALHASTGVSQNADERRRLAGPRKPKR